MSDRRTFILSHPAARRLALECVRDAPEGQVVTVAPPRRNLEQNSLLHALLTEISTRHLWAGKRWDVETWKRLMTAAWCRAIGEPVVLLPALDGQGVDIVFRRTSELTKSECSDLIEFVNAWAATRETQR